MDYRICFNREPKRVLMTGFAPFLNLTTNPSWEGVRSINKKKVECRYNIHLLRKEIEVRYNTVDICVPKMWDEFQPDVVIHVGFDPQAPCIWLEKQARKSGYNQYEDEDMLYPLNYQNRSDGPELVKTDLNVDRMCEEFNTSPTGLLGLRAEKSTDAGRYLCEYIYYTSLCRSTSRTLFVHVPADYSTEQISQGLERILEICLSHLEYLPAVPYVSQVL